MIKKIFFIFFSSILILGFSQNAQASVSDGNWWDGCNSVTSKTMLFLSDKLGVKLAYAQSCSWATAPVCSLASAYHRWYIDEASGTNVADAAQDSDGPKNGTAVGTTIVPGKFGNARNFNGTSDYVSIGDIFTAGTTGTVSIWIKPSGNYSGFQTPLMSYIFPGTIGLGTAFNTTLCSGQWMLYLPNTPGLGNYGVICSGLAYNGTNFPTNVWTHIAVTYDGTLVRFYKNGALVGSPVAQPAAGNSNNATFSIGRQGSYGAGYFSGGIDEVGLWRLVLTPEQILNLFNNNRSGLVVAKTAFSWPAYSFPNEATCFFPTGLPKNYQLNITGNGGGYFSFITNTNYSVNLYPSTDYDWDVMAYDYSSFTGDCGYYTVPAVPGPQPFTTPACALVTVDLKANNSDSPPPIDYNTAADLSWTSSNATSCTASGDWSGAKPLNQAYPPGESTGNLTSSKTYTLTCSNAYSSDVDSVTVNVSSTPPSADIKAKDPSDGVFKDGPITIPSGTATDLTWNSAGADACFTPGGNNGNLTNGPLWVAGQYGSALQFDGTNDYVSVPRVSVPNFISSSPFTISFWAKPSTLSWKRYVSFYDGSKNIQVGLGDGGGGGYRFYVQNSNVSAVPKASTVVISDTNWHNVTVTFDGVSTYAMYLDGVSSSGGAWSGLSTALFTGNSTTIYIGQRGDNASFVNGLVDEVRIYSRVLSLAEIQSDRDNIALPGTVVPPIAYWKFDEGSGLSAGDSAGYPGSWVNPIAVNGGPSSTGNLSSARTYLFTCYNAFGVSKDSATVNVSAVPPPSADIKANGLDGPITVASGENFTVTWCGSLATPCANADSCTVTFSDAGGSWTGVSGTQTYNIATSRIHTLTCTGPGGSAVDTVAVNVSSTPPSADIKAKDPSDGVFKDGPITIPSGTATDLTWNSAGADACFTPGGNNGNLTNGPLWVAGQYGSALQFDGTNDYVSVPRVSVPNFISSSPFTISFWAKPSTLSWKRYVSFYDGSKNIQVGLGDGGGGGYRFYVQNSNVSAVPKASTVVISDTNWHNVTVTFDGVSTYAMYLDGVSSSGGAWSGLSTALFTGNSTTIYIGQRGDNASFVNGLVDEVRIYSRVLSLAEIQSDRDNIALPGTVVPPIAYWKFDEGSGLSAGDSAGYPGSWVNPIAVNGGPSSTGNLSSARTYLFTCYNAFGAKNDNVTVDVSGAFPGDFTLSSGAIQCNSFGLIWTASSGADGYKIFRNSGQIATTTATTYTDNSVFENTSYSYYIQAYNGSGTKNSNTIGPTTTPYCPPTVNLKCDGSDGPLGVTSGDACNLTWTSTNTSGPTPCTASGGWTGSKPPSNLAGEVSPPITSPTTFTLVCTGPGGSTAPQDFVNVFLSGSPLPDWIEIIPK